MVDDEGKMRVALYARVSKDVNADDRRYQNSDNQLVPLREWAARQGWEVYKEYTDKASGANPNRPMFRAMIHDAMMLRFNAILVWRMDRFSREPMSAQVGRIQSLKQRGIGLKSLNESWLDTSQDNPMSDIVMAIMAWAASEERRKISQRTKAAIVRLKNIKQWRGGRPKKRGGRESGGIVSSGGVGV